ncbi:MAG: hypothetical protein JO130_18415 [Solirubrobacterales bacterium]|nr:hypothetical protein [Solirubrobacterales bacterium]
MSIRVELREEEAKALTRNAQLLASACELVAAGDENLQRVRDEGAAVPPLVSAVMKLEAALLVDGANRGEGW